MSAVTDAKSPSSLRPARIEQVAGSAGTGRDTTGGPENGAAGAATGVGTARARGTHARLNPAAELGFSGDPGQHGDPDDGMLHAQRAWDGTLATNRLDELGVNAERQRVETKGVTAAVGLLVDGWPQDVERCVRSVVEHTDAQVLALDLGNVDGAGDVLDVLSERHPERITVWHVAEEPHWRGGTATWGESRAKLLRLDDSDVHVLMETSGALLGDALTPLVAAIVAGAVAAGWHGMEPSDGEWQGAVAEDDGWRKAEATGWREAGPGKVRALSGDLLAVRRSAALTALPEDANYGGNADLELSLALSGDLVVPEERLPVERLGRHDVSPDYRDRECRRNYDGVLRMLRAS
ncbi:hypothetical protein GCM10022419_064600 [Nonomuraea rosea]|uniref:DUF1152 domain-containing protein n=1 Tax=Nonomuraea rosea TaxID=638574 RepID=A0ABP6XYH2_9ACTN